MTQLEYNNLAPDKKAEATRNIIKGELKITEDIDIKDLFGNIFK